MLLFLPIHLTASIKPYQEDLVIRNPYSVVNEKDYELWQIKQAKIKANQNQILGFNRFSCVSYARYVTGINIGPIGLAKNHPVNSNTPTVGGLVITYESWAGHMAVVIALSESTFRVKEYNYISGQYSERDLLYDYKLLKGFYNP